MTRPKEPKIITQIKSRIMHHVAADQMHPMVYVEEEIGPIDIPKKIHLRHEVSIRYDTICLAHMTQEARKIFVERVRHHLYSEFIEDLLELREIACEEGSTRMIERTKEILAYVKGI